MVVETKTVKAVADADANALAFPPTELTYADKVHATYDAGSNMLFVEWQGEVDTEEVKAGYQQILEMAQHFRPNRWVLDLRNRETIKREDQRWVIKNIFSRALQLLECDIFVAIVVPVYFFHTLVNELDGDELMYEDNFMIINHYMYKEEGLRWLESIQDAVPEQI